MKIRESLDELTLRAEEVNTSKAMIDVKNISMSQKDVALLRFMLTGLPSAQRYTKASKEKIGKKCMAPTRK